MKIFCFVFTKIFNKKNHYMYVYNNFLYFCTYKLLSQFSPTLIDNNLPTGPVQISALDGMMLGVGPKQFLCSVVQCETVGPEEHGICDDLSS